MFSAEELRNIIEDSCDKGENCRYAITVFKGNITNVYKSKQMK